MGGSFHALIAAEEYALRTRVAVGLAKSGSRFGYLTTDDGVFATEAADIVVSLVIKGLRPSEN